MLPSKYFLSRPFLYQTTKSSKSGAGESKYPQLSKTAATVLSNGLGKRSVLFLSKPTTTVNPPLRLKGSITLKDAVFWVKLFLQPKQSIFITLALGDSTSAEALLITVSHSVPVTFQ